MTTTATEPKNIFLADDDADDCIMFNDALKELEFKTYLTITKNGVELLSTLEETVPPPPYVIFLDLNMPRKNGFESLKEIRKTGKLKDIPVVIFSTSSSNEIIDKTFHLGANYFICKPPSFFLLAKSIEKVLNLNTEQLQQQPERKQFVLTA